MYIQLQGKHDSCLGSTDLREQLRVGELSLSGLEIVLLYRCLTGDCLLQTPVLPMENQCVSSRARPLPASSDCMYVQTGFVATIYLGRGDLHLACSVLFCHMGRM